MVSQSKPLDATLDGLTPALRQRLAEVLEQYLADLERGVASSIDRLAEQHPEIAAPLRAYAVSLEFLHQAADEFPARDETTPLLPAGDSTERRLGDFLVGREIGRGGMGIVYEAQQISLGRKVALKVLPFAAVLDRRHIARFTNEAQAAAQLHHPHIVPVHSVGCERGVHYYSMQLIDGQPVDRAIADLQRSERLATYAKRDGDQDADATQACQPVAMDGSTLRAFSTCHSIRSKDYIRSAVRLAIHIAEALEHAHQFGVVHRDVKPSNLLLDQEGKIWITDFGLARLPHNASITATGDLLGTARYMSPEQAEGKNGMIDARTDIYSLGITLYELLTLRQAFPGNDRAQIIHRIRNEEPIRPRRLNPSLPVDLETILLKSIAKQRDQRYPTAQEFADDLRRFLEGKPTLAKRPTLADRLTKWASRHRRLVALVSVMMAVGLLGTSIAAFLISQARDEAERNFNQSETHRLQLKQQFQAASELIDQLSRRASELQGIRQALPVRQKLLEDTLGYYQSFVKDAEQAPGLTRELAMARLNMGDIFRQQGRNREALSQYRSALETLSKLQYGDPVPSSNLCADQAVCWNNIGLVLREQGATADAMRAFQQSLTIQNRIADENESPEFALERARTLNNLGHLHGDLRQEQAAVQCLQQAADLLTRLQDRAAGNAQVTRQLAVTLNNLAYLRQRTDGEAATRYNRQAIDLLKQLLADDPQNLVYRQDLALSYNNLGALENQRQRADSARAAYQQEVDLLMEICRLEPWHAERRCELAVALNNLGQLHSQQQDLVQADRCFGEALTHLTELVRSDDKRVNFQSALGNVYHNLARTREKQEQLEVAAEFYTSAIEHQKIAWSSAPGILRYREYLDRHYTNYGRLQRGLGHPDLAAQAALARRQLWADQGVALSQVALEMARIASSFSDPARQQEWLEETLNTIRLAMQHGFVVSESYIDQEPFRAATGKDFVPSLRTLLPRGP